MAINYSDPNIQRIGISNFTIMKWSSGDFQSKNDQLAIEEPLEIVAKYQLGNNTIHKPISVTMRTPGDDFSLILGFLYNEGLITSLAEVTDIEFRFTCDGEAQEQQTAIVSLAESVIPRISNLERHFYTNSSCGVCGKTAIDLAMNHIAYVPKSLDESLNPEQITIAPDILKSHQTLFHETGGIHASGIFDLNMNLLHFAEDVGRHNAMDKLSGWCIKNKILPASDHVLVLSGRTSFELIQKAMSIGIPIVLSVGAPSHLAVELARLNGMSLIGFIKSKSFNIYSGHHRISKNKNL